MNAWDRGVQEGGKSWLIAFKQLRGGGNFWRRLSVLAGLVLSRNSFGGRSGELKMRWRRYCGHLALSLWLLCPYPRGGLLWTTIPKMGFIVFFSNVFTTLSLSTSQVIVKGSVPRTISQTMTVRNFITKYPKLLTLS